MAQTSYNRRPDLGVPGQIARTTPDPVSFEVECQVDTNERKPRPGDPVIYDNTAQAFKVPVGAAELAVIKGIVAYTEGTIPRGTTEQVIEYDDGDLMPIVTVGFVYLRATTGAGVNIRFGDPLTYVPAASVNDEAHWTRIARNVTDITSSSNATAVRQYLEWQTDIPIIAQNHEAAIGQNTTGTIIAAKINLGR